MGKKAIETVFFGNYFLGVLAIALSLETSFQLALPFNSLSWYAALFSAVTVYYTYAYRQAGPLMAPVNPRTEWYRQNAQRIRGSQAFLSVLLLGSLLILFYRNIDRIGLIAPEAWIIIGLAVFAAVAYYGKLPFFNLRQFTLTKPLTIGFCWAVAVSIMPLVVLEVEKGETEIPRLLTGWLFLKNWMFCSVNAVLFDVKDYADDSNRQLKTFVVKYGIRFTISSIIIPMITLGTVSFIIFATYRSFSLFQILINLIPFVLTFYIALNITQKKRSILYYLVLIDGMLLVKAACGILGAVLKQSA